ncbi:MAG: SufD family Fe-S cluster assembly protein, partial [Thiovulaceae bacterium]|nr:SufD family Fe-S cluster assembly protein [Sulfurimonadaceae bacterium]
LQIFGVRDSDFSDELLINNKIILEANSFANLLLCTHTMSLEGFHTEENIDIFLKEGASANIVVMQNENNSSEHKSKFVLTLEKDSKLKITTVTLHGAKITNEVIAHLNGINVNCELNGLCLADGTQTMSTSINVHHHFRNCHSSQLFKGILDDESKAVFIGKIFVDRDAQKTEAYQANHNLLLSKKAKAYVQPQLEIYADDVKCSHGATSGRLDENVLFYMRSRGIGNDEAKLLQQLAFVYDVLDTISSENLKKRLEELVESRLRGEFSHCTNCSVNCC